MGSRFITAVTITMSPRHFVFILISMFSSPVSCYPGALCNVTYDIPLPCDQVFSALAAQMREWDETSECPGQCEQRHFLADKRGPPLTPVTLEGSGEPCEKCPCGQKCLYRYTDASDNFVKGSHITPSSGMWMTLFWKSWGRLLMAVRFTDTPSPQVQLTMTT